MSITHKTTSSTSFILLPTGVNGPTTTKAIVIGPHLFETEEELRKRSVMEKLFHVGVVFKHKNSKVIWEIIEVHPASQDTYKYAIAKSRSSGYRKAIRADRHSYDTMDLVEAPNAVRVLYGDLKHNQIVDQEVTSTQAEPETAEVAFEEPDLSEIDRDEA